MFLLLLLLALAPCLFLLWYFYYRDRYEREPKKKILKIFLIGALMVLPAALLEYALITGLQHVASGIVSIFVMSFIIIAPIEELAKYFTVRRWIYRSMEFNEVMDGIVYTVAASLGFATVENILYVLQHGIAVGIARAFLAVPGHAFFGAIMGFYIGRAKFRIEHETRYLVTGVLLAIFFHGLYDFLALTQTALALLVIVVIIALGIWVFRNLKKAELQSKVRVVEESIAVPTKQPAEDVSSIPQEKIPPADVQ